MKALLAATVLAIVVCLGCDQSQAEPTASVIPLAIQGPVTVDGVETDVCMAALLQGTLVRDERTGLGVEIEDGSVVPVRWPKGWTALDTAPVTLVDVRGSAWSRPSGIGSRSAAAWVPIRSRPGWPARRTSRSCRSGNGGGEAAEQADRKEDGHGDGGPEDHRDEDDALDPLAPRDRLCLTRLLGLVHSYPSAFVTATTRDTATRKRRPTHESDRLQAVSVPSAMPGTRRPWRRQPGWPTPGCAATAARGTSGRGRR